MRILLPFLTVCLLPHLCFAATIHVPSNQPTIQEGIDQANKNDVVLVAPGVYFENIDFKGKAIVVKSEQGPLVTMIDGKQAGGVATFKNQEYADSVLEGFALTNGSGVKTKYHQSGGGVYCLNASPSIRNNIIIWNNVTSFGGGVFCKGSSPHLRNNTITGNSAVLNGGGICCRSSSFGNITNNTISNNVAGINGGGIFCDGFSSPYITNNHIINNFSQKKGGGIYCNDMAGPSVINNTLFKNKAGQDGGGLCCDEMCSLYGWNCILWSNVAKDGPQLWVGPHSNLVIKHSDVQGGKGAAHVAPAGALTWGPGMINATPQFADPNYWDLHLTYHSPCRDMGSNTVITEANDNEGDPRIAYGAVDMGADEFWRHLYHTGNATPGGNIQLKFIGLPSSQSFLWLGSGILKKPIHLYAYGTWYLEFPFLIMANMGSIPGNGVLSFSSPVPLGLPLPLDLPLQAGIGAKLSNLWVMRVK